MNTSLPRKLALLLVSALSLLSFAASAKADGPTLQPRAEKAAPLPVAATFAKVTGDKGPYVLTLKNTSAKAITVSVVVVESVRSHNRPDTRKSSIELAAGKSSQVENLAAHDEVTVSAEGFEPLKLVVGS
jgi:hypothetical protein